MILIEIIYFFLLILFTFYIPGNVLLKFSKFRNKDFIITSVLSISIGVCLFAFSVYVLSWLKLEIFYNVFLVLTLILYLKDFKNIPRIKIDKIPFFEILLIALGTIFTSYIMWRSGSIEGNSLVFYGVNKIDAIYHLSIIGNLKFNFPPTHPGISDFPIRGYNFFYDLILANFSKFYKLQIIDLYFRYFTLFLAIFYGLSGWALGKFMGMRRATIIIFIFLIYFTQGFGGILLPNRFWDSGVVQTIANIVDPSVILSICLLFSLYILIFSKRNKSLIFLAALILGVLPMIKIYTGFLAFAAVGILMLVMVIRRREFYYLKLIFPAVIIALITYSPLNFGSGKLVFAPALLYRHYLESISNSQNLTWYSRLLVFEEHNNYPKIILYKLGFVLPFFYLPSLGIRLINIFFIKRLFNKNFYSENNLFWIIMIFFGFLIPSLFIQSTAVFVTLQFLWITYFILLIPTAYSLDYILEKIGKYKFTFLFILIIILSIPDNFFLLKTYSENPTKIDMDMFLLTKEIGKISNSDKILVLNTNKMGESYQNQYIVPIISGLSSHAVFYEPEVMEFFNTSNQIESRMKTVGDLNSLVTACTNLDVVSNELKTVNSQYIVDLNRDQCFDKLKNVELIFRKGNYSIYKVL